jgi:hypothetical protein
MSGQVKITDGTDMTMNQNSLLELESANKGLLAPRIAINDLDQPDPMVLPVPAGMLVYSTGGLVADGYYFWNGVRWISFYGAEILFTKSETATLLKTEKFVLASGDITLTLPVVTSADNGLAITIKNIGTHLNLITVAGNSGAFIDGDVNTLLTRWQSKIYIAWNGNWITKGTYPGKENKIMVSEDGSFTTIAEAVEFLSVHMTAPVVVLLSSEMNTVAETQVIDLPYPVTFEGQSYGAVTVGPAAGMTGKPIFDCVSDCSFKMISFDGSTLSGYGLSLGEDAIHLTGTGTYHEIKIVPSTASITPWQICLMLSSGFLNAT